MSVSYTHLDVYKRQAEELLHAVWAYGGEQIKKGVPCKPGLKELLSYLEDLGTVSYTHLLRLNAGSQAPAGNAEDLRPCGAAGVLSHCG